MGTNAGYVQPPNPCPQQVFTATEIVALRDSGGLRVDCHYRVQGPVIGTPGNTSPTIVELHAVTASALSKEAKVQQTFNPEGAFIGSYDPDADTANGGTLNELIDHWNNQISDEDAGSVAGHTVHTQWPYHLASTNLRDNVINDSTLIGLDTALPAGGRFNDNTIRNSTVDITGRAAAGAFFDQNVIETSTVTAHNPTSFIRQNQITGATVSNLGTTGASFSFQNNVMLTGTVNVDAATTAQVTMNNNVFGGTSGGYRVAIRNRTAGLVTISGNRLFNNSGGAQDLLVDGPSGTVTVASNEIGAGSISFLAGVGNASSSISSSELRGVTVTKQAGCLAPSSITNSKLSNCTVTYGAANNASTNLIQQCDIRSGQLQLLGPVAAPGRNDIQFIDADTILVTVAATATGGVNLNGGYYNISGPGIQQNRTAGTSSLSFYGCDMRGVAQVIDNGTTDPGAPVENSFNRCRFVDTVVNVGNMSGRTGNTIAQQLECVGSTLTISGLGTNKFLDKGRMLGATLDNAGFQIQTFDLMGVTKTLTADQSNKLANPSFDNVV